MKKSVIGVFLLGIFLSCCVGSSASAKAIDPAGTAIPVKGKVDLKVSITSIDENICSSYASGFRWIMVWYNITNMGMYTSSNYYTAIFVDGSFLAGGYASSPNGIPAMGMVVGGMGGTVLAGSKRLITVEVTPINPIPSGIGWHDAMTNYANRSLDSNASNNTFSRTVHITACP